MPATIHLGTDRVIHAFSARNAPALEVDSGDTIAVETLDAYGDQFHQDRDVAAYLRERGKVAGNPATGPIRIRGLLRGDGLDVRIEKIALSAVGFVAAVPGIGVLGDMGIEPRVAAFHVRPDGLWYEGRLRLPLRPMVGTIGVTPAGAPVPTLELGYHGGNLDCNAIVEGATLHFPVLVDGGLLALGDVHASMGSGEVYSGVNIHATVTIQVERVAGAGWERPWLETATEVMTLGIEERIEDAIREATLGMTRLIQRRLGLSLTEAVVLTGAACDIRLGQASKFGTRVSAYAVFPKEAL